MTGREFDESSSQPAPLRKCTKCLDQLDSFHFYSKGNRLDSICKSCKKEKRRSTYVSQHSEELFDRIIKVFETIYESERCFLELQKKKLDEILSRHQPNLLAA